MDWVNFGLLLNDHLVLYAAILTGSILFYFLLFRKYFISILDPLVFTLLFSVFGFSVVWFLYFTNSIATKYLYSYLLTQTAFWLGLFTFKKLTRNQAICSYKSVVFREEKDFAPALFLISSFIYIIAQLLSYVKIGIPLFLGTHIDIYREGGGWGIIGRVLDVLKPCAIFMLIYYMFKKTEIIVSIYKYAFLVIVIIFFGLSGSKGEFMLLGFLIFCFLLLNAFRFIRAFRRINKLGAGLIIAGILFAMITIIFQPGSTAENQTTLEVFLFRLVASGDTYFFAYPNANIEHLDNSRALLALFGDLFSTIRLVPRENQPVILGVQLFRMFSNLDISAGPNARHNVFGYAYFGFFGSILFSYVIGLILSLVRNVLFFDLRKSLLGQLCFVFLYINLAGIETDPPMAISNLENVLLIFPVLMLIVIVCVVFLQFKPRPDPNLQVSYE